MAIFTTIIANIPTVAFMFGVTFTRIFFNLTIFTFHDIYDNMPLYKVI